MLEIYQAYIEGHFSSVKLLMWKYTPMGIILNQRDLSLRIWTYTPRNVGDKQFFTCFSQKY